MKIRTKIVKLQMHENLHKNENENSHFCANFYEGHMLQLYTANFLNGFMFLIHLK